MFDGLNGILRQVSDLNKHIEEIKNKPEDVKQDIENSVSESLPDFAQVFAEKKMESDGSLGNYIKRVSQTKGVDEDLVKAVIDVESNFDPKARSEEGAMGLMQLMPETARELGVNNPDNPRENIEGGVEYLGQLIDEHNNLEEALAAYNAGPEAVERHGGVPPFDETQDYVKKVLSTFRQLKESGTSNI